MFKSRGINGKENVNSQSETSCHFSLSWHCQKIQGWGWLARAAVPVPPVKKDGEENIFKSWCYARESFINSFFKHIFIWLLQNILKQAKHNQLIITADKKEATPFC